MSKDLNKVQLIGRLGFDPETKYTQQGSAITTMRIASGRSWRTAEGEPREDTEWFRVIAWNKLGEICAQYLTKGSKVYIEGRLQTRSWDDQQSGQKRYSTEVVATDMIMLDSKRDGAPTNYDDAPDVGYAPDPDFEEPAPAARQPAPQRATNNAAPAQSNGNGARPAPARPAAPAATAPRRPVAPAPVNDDEDLPF